MKKLAIVGSGIKTLSHLTNEAKAHIIHADKVLHLVNEPLMKQWLDKHSKQSESLDNIYFDHGRRIDAYQAIAEHMYQQLLEHDYICIVLYGHPTVFAAIGLDLLRLIEKNQLEVEHVSVPGISAMDCLFADLNVDPGNCGCFSVDVNDLLLFQKNIEPHSHLILWQIGLIGNCGAPDAEVDKDKLCYLKDYLLEFYEETHEVVLYEASLYPSVSPKIIKATLSNLVELPYTSLSTLYIPPLEQPQICNQALDKLGLSVTMLNTC